MTGVGTAIWIFNTVLVGTLLLLIMARWVINWHGLVTILQNPVQSMFLGAIPMAVTTVVNGFVDMGPALIGHLAISIALWLWMANVLLAVVSGIAVPFFMFVSHTHTVDKLTGLWLMRQVLPERQEKAPESEQPRTQPAAPPLPQRQWPDLSPYPQVALNAIKVPAAFLARKPNKEKTEALKASVVAHGQLDEPIVVRPALDGVGYVLYDGYRRYIIARQLGWTTVPVDVRSISDEASSGVRAAR